MGKMTIKNFLLLVTTGFFISCSPGLRVSSGYDKSADFSAYRTFSLNNLKTSDNVNAQNTQRITNSIKTEMISKGFTENNSNPDLMINVAMVVKNRQSTSSPSYFKGFDGSIQTQVYWGQNGKASGQATAKASKYKDGSLVIDVVDADTKKSVWHGAANAEIGKAPENPDAAISSAVTKIMASFPVEAEIK
jgi:Domain of unknown function (DUF4136)